MTQDQIANLPKNLIVSARTPGKVIYDGECMAVSAQNTIGPFDVLPGHGNFITNINGTIIIHNLNKKDKIEYPVQMGIMRVHQNTVHLYIILSGDDNDDDQPQAKPSKPDEQKQTEKAKK